MMSSKPRILVTVTNAWPGNDASGPIQSVRGLAGALSDEFDFLLLARDRGYGPDAPPGPQGWVARDGLSARYLAPGRFGVQGLAQTLRETSHDVLWLSSFFDRQFTLPALLARRGDRSRAGLILSPRGEFAAGALSLKSAPKRLYAAWLLSSGLLSDAILHATTDEEAGEIAAILPGLGPVCVAGNLARLPAAPSLLAPETDTIGVMFVGRISPVKNLDIALAALAHVRSPVRFTIIGPIRDEAYWRACQAQIAALPARVETRFIGEIANAALPAEFAAHDLLLLPTKSENFGHAIFEALANGLPCVISDTTPWRSLEANRAGWDLPLGDPARFAAAIDAYAAFSREARAELRSGARRFAERSHLEGGAAHATRAMLRQAVLRIEHARQAHRNGSLAS